MKQLFAKKRYIISALLTLLMVFCISMSGYANVTPVFTDGDSTTRTVAENTTSGTNIGDPVAATDADNDVLTYGLSGTDAASFSIVSTTGQLQTRAALDYETKASYSVTVSVSDGNGGSGSITVSINVTDVNERPPRAPKTLNSAPIFTEGDSTTRTIAENTASGENIGAPVAATDVDANNDTLTYTLGGTDAAAFSIVRTTGQLQTRAALDYETKPSYAVSVSVSDGNGGSDSITVTIDIRDVPEITPPLSERTPQVRDAIIAKLPGISNANDVNPAHLAVIRELDVSNKKITALKTGDFNGLTTLSRLELGWNALSDISALAGLTSLTELLVYGNAIRDISVVAGLTSLRQLFLGDNSISNISAVAGLTSLTRLDLHNNSLSDISALARLTSLTTLHLGDNSLSDISVLSGLTSLTSLRLNNNSIRDVSALEDLTSLTHLYLKGNPISEYGPLRRLKAAIDAIAEHPGLFLDITIPPENHAPVFSGGTNTIRSIAENTASGQNIGTPVAATDADTGDVLTYTLGGTDAAAFSIVSTSGQLQTSAALDYETKSSYSVTVSVSDSNGGSDSIPVTINVSNVNEAPVFTEGATATRTVAENTASGENIGDAVAATDVDANTTLVCTLGGTDAASFSINGTTGQLQTNAALDYETKTSYSVRITVSDGSLTDTIAVTIGVSNVNEAPAFAPGSITLTVAEDTASGTNIGDPITATDPDSGDTLTYSLQRGDAESFRIDANTGQLQTSVALDYETKNAYTDLAVRAMDSAGLVGSTRVTINVTDNSAPEFTDGSSTTRSVAENMAAGTNIGTPVAATDADNDVLTYTLGGTDASSFSIVSTTGQLQTNAALDFESSKTSYSIIVKVSDSSLTDSITVTIDVTDVNEPPVFTEGTTATRTVAEGNTIGANIGAPVAATDQDGDTLEYMFLDFFGTNPDDDAFSTDSTTGQIRTKAPLDYETKNSYRFAVGVNDSGHSYPDIVVTIDVTDVDESNNNTPVFPGDTTTTFSVPEHSAADTNIGTPVTATDADTGDTLTYSLGGADAALFSIVSTTGQLETKADLDYESSFEASKTSYSVAVNVSDDGGLTDGIAVTITVTDVDEPGNDRPLFTERGWVRRYVAENTASGQNIGSAFTVTDSDADDTLIYSLVGTGAASFSIVSTTGQLQTKAALDRETKSYYNVTVSVSDGNGGSDSITVYISVTNVNEDPSFTEGSSATRTVAENTDAGENIGDPVAATDVDRYSVLTYSLDGTDAASFSIVSTSGQLQTSAALDYEIKTSYSVTITVSDRYGGSDSIDVTIDVTDIAAAAPSVETPPLIPENTGLLTNYPNPFNPETWIPYQLAEPAEVTLTIYDVRGVVVRRLDLGYQAAGFYHSRSRAIHWDGRNGVGEKVASGLYFYTFTAGDFTATRKLLIRK